MLQTVKTLMAGLIDYAGLFPPAKLDMQPTVENYARYLAGEDAWVVGRIIVPVSRFEEFEKCAAPLMPGTYATSGYREWADAAEQWHISALVDIELPAAIDAVFAFNERHAAEDNGRACIDMLELKAADPSDIDDAMDQLPEGLFPAFEVPIKGDVRGFAAALAGGEAAAKVRCGGVTPEAFPSAAELAAFIDACAKANTSFKATAGLHHAIRADYNLTYAENSPKGTMHGFLNVFIAAAMAKGLRIEQSDILAILDERDPKAFEFLDDGIRWKGHILESSRLARARESFSLSYGSCSFEEPTTEMRDLGLM